MISVLFNLGVLLIAGYFYWLAWLAFFKPERAKVFLELFASSPKAHFIEMGFRVLAGMVLIGASPGLAFSDVYFAFGLILIATSAVLLVLPWRWHQAFARKVIPWVVSQVKLFGACSFILGSLLFASLLISLLSRS